MSKLKDQNWNTVGALSAIIEELTKRGIKYCHWKSNFHLDYALRGDEDWDVLIERTRFEEFCSVLHANGFKSATSISKISQPGVFHFYGHDEETGLLVHIHAYSRILSGDHLLKSYALPFEELLLSNTTSLYGMPVPTKAAELIVSVIRGALKYSTPVDIKLSERGHKGIREEFEWLLEDNSFDSCQPLLEKHFPEISFERFRNAAETVTTKGQLVNKIQQGLFFSKVLKKYRRYSFFASNILTISMLFTLLWNKFVHKQKYMNLSKGGIIITLIGPQATGKSTLAEGLRKWLGSELQVSCVHVGKPPATFLTWLPRYFLPLLRKAIPSQRSTVVERNADVEPESSVVNYSYLHLFRKLMLAYDRKSVLSKIFRDGANGKIVICDRYPSEVAGAVDGSSFSEEIISQQSSKYKKWLMALESKMYSNFNAPNLVLQLTVPVDVAVQRDLVRDKLGPKDSDYVRFRHGMKNQPVFTRCPVEKINTDQELLNTLESVKKCVWGYL